MHHIIVTTLISSEHQRLSVVSDRAVPEAAPSRFMANLKAMVDRAGELLQTNRRSEPEAIRLDRCNCACHTSRS